MYTFTGERKLDTLLPKLTSSPDALAFHEPISGNPFAYATYIQAIFLFNPLTETRKRKMLEKRRQI